MAVEEDLRELPLPSRSRLPGLRWPLSNERRRRQGTTAGAAAQLPRSTEKCSCES
jgi:hypothetical protein